VSTSSSSASPPSVIIWYISFSFKLQQQVRHPSTQHHITRSAKGLSAECCWAAASRRLASKTRPSAASCGAECHVKKHRRAGHPSRKLERTAAKDCPHTCMPFMQVQVNQAASPVLALHPRTTHCSCKAGGWKSDAPDGVEAVHEALQPRLAQAVIAPTHLHSTATHVSHYQAHKNL
jgi:hypothetical protein